MAKNKLNIEELALDFENGDPHISLENVLKIQKNHGIIVGGIFSYSPREDASLKLFFSDGYLHVAYGFMAGEKADPDDLMPVIGLKMVLSLIPGIAPRIEGDYLLTKVLTSDHMKGSIERKEYVTLQYIFRPPAEVPEIVQTTKGFATFEKAIEIISTDPHSRLIEGEW